MNDIIPAILPESYGDLASSLAKIVGAAPLVQIDICDGVFVAGRSWPLNPADRAHFTEIVKGDEGLPHWQDFNFEVDLMVHTPEKFLPSWVAMGISRAVVHLESQHDWSLIQDAAGGTVELGIAIDLDPPFEKLGAYVPRVEYVQIMGIARLGRQGEELDVQVYELIKKVRAEFPDVTIQIDGGVREDNAHDLLSAGADRLVVGSQIVKAVSPTDAVKKFQSL